MSETDLEKMVRRYEEDHAIVERVWKALGIETYEQAKPFTIDEHVAKLRTELAEARRDKERAWKIVELCRNSVNAQYPLARDSNSDSKYLLWLSGKLNEALDAAMSAQTKEAR